MIRNITFFALFIFSTFAFGQIGPVGHLTIFSEDGDKFFLYLNGEQINDIAQTNLRVEDLNQPYYNAKIKFEDKALQDVSKNSLMLVDADEQFSDVTYKIKRDKNSKGKMKLNYFSSIPVRPNFIPASNVHVVHYGQPDVAVIGNSTQTTTTTTTQTGTGNMGVGISMGGVNMGISIQDPDMGQVVTHTTTTTTTSGTSGGHQSHDYEEAHGCGGNRCMNTGDFNSALATIKKQNFEETRLKTAKQVITANCLNVSQIMQIANTFNFEDNKLDFAKYAYDYCIEPKNYFKLNGIFNFSSNVDELSDYVQSRQ